VGYVSSYASLKYIIKYEWHIWTKDYRIFALVLSLLSFFGVLAILFSYFLFKAVENEEEATW
jgi:hypothetical protein